MVNVNVRGMQMNDKEFSELQLRMTIVPQQVRWPAPEYLHWRRLHEVANEARERVSKFYAWRTRSIATRMFLAMANTASAVRLRLKRLPTSRHRKRWASASGRRACGGQASGRAAGLARDRPRQ